MPQIPAHIFWPGFIISLLSVAILASFSILFFASSDGGPQVIPDYYAKSVDFEEVYQARQRSLELGWELDLDASGTDGQLVVRSAKGDAIRGAQGKIVFFRPSLAEPLGAAELIEDDAVPGLYHFENMADTGGSWDFDIQLNRGSDHYIERLRHRSSSS